MRAAFSDPQGPRLWRSLPYALPALLLLVGIFGPWTGATSTMIGFAAVAGAHLVGVLPLRQTKRREVELECGPGWVDVRSARNRTQRIHAKDIVGASTARTSSGVLVTLAHRKRDEPIVVELWDEAAAEKVRHALGIGHGGFGTLAWRTVPGDAAKNAFIGRVMVIVSFVLAAIATLASADSKFMWLVATAVLPLAFTAFLMALVGWLAPPGRPTLVMTPEGVQLWTPRGWFTVPYGAILGIEVVPGGLVVRLPPPYDSVRVETATPYAGPGLSAEDRDALLAQLRTATARARGLGPQKEDVTARVDILRRHGESPREWLVRLDMAGQTLSSGSGYRGNTLEPSDLWAILEDPDADAELRAAAARVLRHRTEPDTKVRIEAAAAAMRDETASKRVRVAIRDDLEHASLELAALDEAEQRAHAYHGGNPRY